MDEYHGRWLHSCVFRSSHPSTQSNPRWKRADNLMRFRGQEVTLTTTEPHTRLRVQSITPDHGLLRCVALSSQSAGSGSGLTPLYDRGDFGGDDRVNVSYGMGAGAGRAKVEYVDLQPDGNSFDMMSGLIKRKV
jgi:biotin--protein ligase